MEHLLKLSSLTPERSSTFWMSLMNTSACTKQALTPRICRARPLP